MHPPRHGSDTSRSSLHSNDDHDDSDENDDEGVAAGEILFSVSHNQLQPSDDVNTLLNCDSLSPPILLPTCRTVLEFANANDYGVGYVWEAPYPGAGPETPAWDKTPASVGQGATNVMDEAHREHNVLGNDYMYPDYARAPRKMQLWQQQQQQVPRQRKARTGLWIGAPQSFLPPDGDYPGGSTGIPEDGEKHGPHQKAIRPKTREKIPQTCAH
jgi:hypothetical protein